MQLSQLSILWEMCLFEAARYKAFPWEVAASLVSRITSTALFVIFWLVVANYSSDTSLDASQLVSYYLITIGIVPLFFTNYGISTDIIRSIKLGSLNQVLIKPINPLLYPWAVRFGKGFIGICFGLIAGFIGVVIAGGMSVDSLPMLVVALVNTALINFGLNVLIGSIGFYLIEGQGIKNAAIHVSRLARGELVPLFLMPAGLASALQFTPFPAGQYHLVIILQGGVTPSWSQLLIGSAWGIFLAAAAKLVWARSLRKYEAVGL